MAEFSKEPPSYFEAQQPVAIRMCCIAFSWTDRIRLIGVPQELFAGIRETITSHWGPIQQESEYYGAYEFKLKGNPWTSSSYGNREESGRAHYVLNGILKYMARSGFNLVQSSDVSKLQQDLDTLFFESCQPDPEVQTFAMSFNKSDRIRIIGAPTAMPYVKKAVLEHWAGGIQRETTDSFVSELKLAGNPWYSIAGKNEVATRLLLLNIMGTLRSFGYKLYASADVSRGHEGHDIETWIFRRVGSFWQ